VRNWAVKLADGTVVYREADYIQITTLGDLQAIDHQLCVWAIRRDAWQEFYLVLRPIHHEKEKQANAVAEQMGWTCS